MPLYALLGFTLMRHWFAEPITLSAMLRETLARMYFSTSGSLHGVRFSSRSFLDSISIAWGVVLVYAVVVILRPVLQPTVETTRDRRRAIELLREHGDTTTSFMTTWPGNTMLINGERDAYIAYRLISNVAIVLGDPIGTSGRLSQGDRRVSRSRRGERLDALLLRCVRTPSPRIQPARPRLDQGR